MLVNLKITIDPSRYRISPNVFINYSEDEKERIIMKLLNSDHDEFGLGIIYINSLNIVTLERIGRTNEFAIEVNVTDVTISEDLEVNFKRDKWTNETRGWAIDHPFKTVVVKAHSKMEALATLLLRYHNSYFGAKLNLIPYPSKKFTNFIIKRSKAHIKNVGNMVEKSAFLKHEDFRNYELYQLVRSDICEKEIE